MKGAHSGSCTVDEKHTHAGMTQHRGAMTALTVVLIYVEVKMYVCSDFVLLPRNQMSSPPNTHRMLLFPFSSNLVYVHVYRDRNVIFHPHTYKDILCSFQLSYEVIFFSLPCAYLAAAE